MSMTDKAKGLGAKLKLDSHHAIERFGVIFAVLSVVGVLLVGSTAVSAFRNNQEAMDSTSLYVNQFTTSRTQLSGTVPGVYVSPDRTRALVMMHFSDPSKISTTASSYQAFLSGATMEMQDQPLKNEWEGQVVVFGSTGFIGMVLDSTDGPFAEQVLNLTMRANSELVYSPGDAKIRSDLRGQNSFIENDQWRIYFNPSASSAQVVESLAGRSFDPGAVYYELVVAPKEATTRQALEDQLGVMRADLARIAEYEDALGRTSTLDGDFLVNPRVPTPQDALRMISGDEVVGEEAVRDEDGEVITASTLELETDWVGPDGFDFDWRNGSIKEGYLHELVPEGQRYGQWLTAKSQAGRGGSDSERVRFRPTDVEWTLTDGTLLADHERARTTGMNDVLALRTNLSSAYSTYWDSKEAYQVTLPLELLNMEVELRGVEQSSSINDAEGSFNIY